MADKRSLIKWGGRLVVLFGSAHTLGAFVVEGAARHTGAWSRGELWGSSFSEMTPAMSAYWFSVNSFGPALILLGATVSWMNRRDITPPPFIGWALAGWTVLDAVAAGPGVGQGLILLAASGLLLAGSRHVTDPVPAVTAH